jgi:hypothetical protein
VVLPGQGPSHRCWLGDMYVSERSHHNLLTTFPLSGLLRQGRQPPI